MAARLLLLTFAVFTWQLGSQDESGYAWDRLRYFINRREF